MKATFFLVPFKRGIQFDHSKMNKQSKTGVLLQAANGLDTELKKLCVNAHIDTNPLFVYVCILIN